MRAIPGVYDGGKVEFPFYYPEYLGPVSVLVIFPGPAEETMVEFDFDVPDAPQRDVDWEESIPF